MANMKSDALLAEMAIRSTLEQYFSSIDRYDWPKMGACFTENAKAEYDAHGDVLLVGRQAIMDQISSWMTGIISTHTFSNAHIVVSGRSAKAESRTVAYLVMGTELDRHILVRGITYFDALLLSPNGVWEIDHRIHRATWQYKEKSLSPAL